MPASRPRSRRPRTAPTFAPPKTPAATPAMLALALAILPVAGLVLLPYQAQAQAQSQSQSQSQSQLKAATEVSLDASSSVYLRTRGRIARVSVAAPDIADVAAFPPNQVLVTGKRVGRTTATVWLGDADVQVLMIEVTYPIQAIADAIVQAVPGAVDVDVRQAGEAVVLSGQVPSVADVQRAEQIAGGFLAGAQTTGSSQVINSMTIPGDQQVQIEVSFAEVSRSALREIGVNFWSRKDNWAGGLLNPATPLSGAAPSTNDAPGVSALNNGADQAVPLLARPISGTFGAIFSSAIGDFPFSATLSLLANRGYARVLTEPTLVALSGQSASFLAGGEFPIPLPQSLGTIGVDYKKFGIQLKFTPTVVGDTIQLRMGMTVSDIDFSTGVRLASVNVPGLTTRHADSTIRMRDGQSFVVAGLLSDRVRSTVDKVPGLGELPILGSLFRSTSYRREETELLVVVTAKRVRPLGERPELPGENTRVDPNDLQLFLLGTGESRDGGSPNRTPARAPRKSVAPVGAVGFAR